MAGMTGKIRIRHRLLTRLLFSHILIVSLPLLITGKVLVDTAQNSIKETILKRNLEFASRSTRFVDLKLRTAIELVKSQAQIQSIFQVTRSMQELSINTLVTQFDVFDEIALLDTLGRVKISTSFEEVQRPPTGGSKAFAAMLAAFRQGRTYQSDVFVSNERLPLLAIAEPVMLYNQIVGILYAVVDLKALWDLVEENKVGEKGEAFVFDKEGVYIAHSDRRKVYSEERFRNRDFMRKVQAKQSGQTVYTTTDGVEMVAAYAPIGEYGWGAMLQQPTSEAFAPAHRMRFRVIQAIVISVLLASLLAYFFSKRIVKPVNELVSGMERFSEGELHHRIRKSADDEIGELSDSFNEMAERLIEFQNKLKRTEVLETLSKLASILSHEIRNPLNSMVINMQILKRELSREKMDKARVDKFYSILAAEIKRVDKLVGDFLQVARPPKMEKAEVAINDILDDVLLMQVADSLNKGIRIEREYEKTPIRAYVDAAKLRQVFLNLAINAIQAMPGGGRLTVRLQEIDSAENPGRTIRGGGVLISFSDTGAGIEPKDLERVFDFYYSTKEEGTGLGLAIVQQIVDEHQGKVTVDSKPGEGTTFSVYIPVRAG